MAEASGVQANTTPETKDYMTPALVARGVEQEYISPKLIWENLFTSYVGQTEKAFRKPVYMVDSSGNRITPEVSDARRSPVLHAPGTYIPKIGQDTFTYETDSTVPYALGMEFDESVRERPMREITKNIIDAEMRTFAASWAQHMNSEVLSEVYGSTYGTEDGSATWASYMDHSDGMSYDSTKSYVYGELDSDWYWNTADADYLTDLLNLKTIGSIQADSYGFSANFNMLAMHITVLEDMVLWGQNNDKKWELNPLGNGRAISNIQGYNIMSLDNVDGLSSTYWDHVLFWDSNVKPATSVYWTGTVENYQRWGPDAKLMMAMHDHGPDDGNSVSYLARGEYKTFVNPTAEFFYGAIEVY